MKIKLILCVGILFLSFHIFGQDQIPLAFETNNDFTVTKYVDSLDFKIEIIEVNSVKVSERRMKQINNAFCLQGLSKTWYPTGELKSSIHYKEGNVHGSLIKYDKSGSIVREDRYENGKMISGKCYDQDGNEIDYVDYFTKLGMKGVKDNDYLQLISKKLTYPSKAKRKGQSGVVLASAIVSKTGALTDIQIVNSVSKELDREVVRVLNDLPNFTPMTMEGEAIATLLYLPFSFELPEVKENQ